ncbi:MAG: thiosulfate oxidation carrier complex protein SoxZ [Candidatus Rokubacteria bacterium]|nr:thiosulfate oxidation carrier complex protein SoxZ [Candidatus Rokubacteria bacterium]MBI3028555.1 thiosulfate oxidation carrier complex protein SoxZ [Candidatus Rokubacteria bacterium]
MAEIGKVRIRIPSSIKRGDVVRVRSLVIHPMEIVQRRDGKPVDKNYLFIHKVTVAYNGREILEAETTQSISENPFFSFTFKPTEPGMLRITFLDTHGGKYEGTAEIKFA